MLGSRWRFWLLLVFCLLFIAQEAGTIPLTLANIGYTGAYPSGREHPFAWKITSLRGGTASRAGVRTGDVLDARALSPVERFRFWSQAPVAATTERFPIRRAGAPMTIDVPVAHQPIPWELWLAIVAGFWSGLCAIVLLVRKPDDPGVRTLVLYLLMVRLSIQMSPQNWVTPYPALDLLNAVLFELMPIGWALLAEYAASFAPHNRLVRILKYASYGLAAYVGITGALAAIGSWTGAIDPMGALFAGAPYFVAFGLYVATPLACAIVSLRSIRGQQRERLAWLLGPTVVIQLIYVVYTLASFVPFFNTDVVTVPSLVLQLLAPVGITYAMLNRRLLDIGFALNRAAVYTGVSVVTVGIFVLVEWAFSEWFKSATHTENLLVSGALALILGFSIRMIHARVDALLDRVFFRKRHEDEQALKRFAREVLYITDPTIVLARTSACVERHADASFVHFALYDGSRAFGGVDENDPALVSLRASQQPVDLTSIASALEGEWAFPMVVRGRLIGAMSLGPKRSGESFDPDEFSAVGDLAYAVATALDALEADHRTVEQSLLEGINAIQAMLREMKRSAST